MNSPIHLPTTSSLATDSLDLSSRLVPLYDGRSGLRNGLSVQTCMPPDPQTAELPLIDFIVSNQALDRYDELIVPSGWRLDHYRSNPVFQNAHQYGDIIFTLGKAVLTEVRPICGQPALFQRVEFAVDVNPMARIAYGLYKGKFLNAVSVGFIPIRWENGGPEADYRRKYLEQELLEVSAVGIPANPEALQLGLQSGAVHRSDVQDLLELLMRAKSWGQNHEERERGQDALLLGMARALRDVLRQT